MKNYSKAKIIAKNKATGSYSAGCPENHDAFGEYSPTQCKRCERTM